MRKAKLLLVPVLILAAFGGGWLSLPSRPPYLVRLDKTGPSIWDTLFRCEIDVAQELDTCFLIRADEEDIAALRGRGFGLTVLDRRADTKDFYLVQVRSAEEREFLLQLGRAVFVEGETWLYAGPRGDPSLAIPETMACKPLAETSLLPYLRRPSSVPVTALAAPSHDGTIDLIVAGVNGGIVRSFVEGLQSFQTRDATTPNGYASAEYILQYFQSLGLRASFAPFTFRATYSSQNVIAEKTGLRQPDEVVIIGGHYDSDSDQPATLAPGADDNASGVAAVMEAARLLSRYDFDFTVKFIAFGAEEWGLYGAADYATRARAAGERIVGVINLDMIGYADAVPEDLDLIVNGFSEWLAERLKLAAGAYVGLATRKLVTASANYSDHAPFWDRGYPAVLAIEDMPLTNPYYHRTTDTADKLNDGFFVSSTR
ncbi:MAG: M20/M25/M40 family metallo-hydrolase, partial [Candidatus Aminicenantes bacterium]|nr:M20/M25/M40 family metallo-hydrolase [Candidatus Aminicenantes bacterium]